MLRICFRCRKWVMVTTATPRECGDLREYPGARELPPDTLPPPPGEVPDSLTYYRETFDEWTVTEDASDQWLGSGTGPNGGSYWNSGLIGTLEPGERDQHRSQRHGRAARQLPGLRVPVLRRLGDRRLTRLQRPTVCHIRATSVAWRPLGAVTREGDPAGILIKTVSGLAKPGQCKIAPERVSQPWQLACVRTPPRHSLSSPWRP